MPIMAAKITNRVISMHSVQHMHLQHEDLFSFFVCVGGGVGGNGGLRWWLRGGAMALLVFPSAIE